MKHNYEIEKWLIKMVIQRKLNYEDKIPSKKALEIKFQLSKNAVETSLINLKRLRIIYSKPKKGYFICPNSQQAFLRREQDIKNFSGYKIFWTKSLNKEQEMKIISSKLASFCLVPHKEKTIQYKKHYFDTNKQVQKISFNYDLLVDKARQKQLLKFTTLNALILKDYEGLRKIEKITWEDNIPKEVTNILKITSDKIVVKYIGILNKQNLLIHMAKFYINLKFLNEKNFY